MHLHEEGQLHQSQPARPDGSIPNNLSSSAWLRVPTLRKMACSCVRAVLMDRPWLWAELSSVWPLARSRAKRASAGVRPNSAISWATVAWRRCRVCDSSSITSAEVGRARSRLSWARLSKVRVHIGLSGSPHSPRRIPCGRPVRMQVCKVVANVGCADAGVADSRRRPARRRSGQPVRNMASACRTQALCGQPQLRGLLEVGRQAPHHGHVVFAEGLLSGCAVDAEVDIESLAAGQACAQQPAAVAGDQIVLVELAAADGAFIKVLVTSQPFAFAQPGDAQATWIEVAVMCGIGGFQAGVHPAGA
jgi:hypothetical protein